MNRAIKISSVLLFLFITTVTTLYSQKVKNTLNVEFKVINQSSSQTNDIEINIKNGTPPYKIYIVNEEHQYIENEGTLKTIMKEVKSATYSIAITDKNHKFYVDKNFELK